MVMMSLSWSRGSNQRAKGSAKSTSGSGSSKRGRGCSDDGWGGFSSYMAAKKYKLGEQFDVENKELQSGIFHGVAIYINGYTKPSSDELRRLITAHGGKFEMYLSKTKVTHIIAANLPNSKFHLAKTTPVVKPEWITDSVASGKRLPLFSYMTIGNKSQAGLKSFPSVTSLGSSSSTSSIICVDSLGSNSNFDPLISNNCFEDSNKDANDVKQQEKFSNLREDNGTDTNVPTALDMPTFQNNTSLSNECDNLGNTNRECHDTELGNDEDQDSCTELESDIVYNSEDEVTPQRFKPNFSRLSKGSRHLNSSSDLISSSFHFGNNNSSTPKSRIKPSSSEDLHFRNISGQGSMIEFNLADPTPVSPIQEKEDPEENGFMKSIPVTVTPTKESPSKFVSSSKPSIAKAGDKGFLNEYYSNSRLHHISTWGAEFKAYVADIQQKGDSSFPGRNQLRQSLVENATRLCQPERLASSSHGCVEKTVMHIDMDCFFVSVGLLSRPDFKGKPVAVTHSKGQGTKPDPKADAVLEKRLWNMKKDKGLKSGAGPSNEKPARNEYDFAVPDGSTGFQTFHSMAEIASCSYEARQRGVKNGMFMGKAKTLCPDLLTIPYDFEEYSRISHILYDTVASFTHDIEAVSCDEMFMDCTDVLSDTGATAVELAGLLRKQVFDKTRCAASVGIGPSILLARLATKKAKPDGVFQVFKPEAKYFIKDQKVSDLPGVGYSMSNKLTRLGVTTCEDLQSVAVSTLRREFGPKTGESLHRFSLGIDDREVNANKQRKSVSAEVNYGIRFKQEPDAFKFLKELSDEVAKRLESLGFKGRSITLKLMVKRPDAPVESAKFMGHGICNTVTKSTILLSATSDGSQIGQEVVSMYKHHKISAPDVRGIGIQVQRLESIGGKGHQSNSVSGCQSILQFAVSRKLPNHTEPSIVLDSKGSERNGPGKKSSERNLERKNTIRDASEMRDVSFLLSPSQVSETVLNELPVDIAQEIRNGIQQHNERKNLQSGASTSSAVVEAPSGPSTSSNQNNNEISNVDDLPSESQLDMSCFHALPRSLQKELEEAYAKQRHMNKPEEKRSSPIKGTALEKLRSPTKDKGKQKKKKRGRPPGSRKQLLTGNMTKLKPRGTKSRQGEDLKLRTVTGSKEAVVSVVDGVICLDDDDNDDGGCDSRDAFTGPEQDIIEPAHLVSPPKVEFCGASSMKDVRTLFKEWLESCAEPGDSDVAMVTDYLTSLIHHRYLEQAFCLLKFLMRYVQTSSRSAVWKQCTETITALVQSVVKEVHGTELKLLGKI